MSGQEHAAQPGKALIEEKSKQKVSIPELDLLAKKSLFAEGSREQWLITPASSQAISVLSFLDEYEFIIAPLIFTALAFFTRMWKIGLSPIVTWDEAQ